MQYSTTPHAMPSVINILLNEYMSQFKKNKQKNLPLSFVKCNIWLNIFHCFPLDYIGELNEVSMECMLLCKLGIGPDLQVTRLQ